MVSKIKNILQIGLRRFFFLGFLVRESRPRCELSHLLGWPLFHRRSVPKTMARAVPECRDALEEYMKSISLKEHKAMDLRARKVLKKDTLSAICTTAQELLRTPGSPPHFY